MFPNILMFHPEAARAILEYRIRTLGGALGNAQNLGYQVRGTWALATEPCRACSPHTPPRPVSLSPGPLSGQSWDVLDSPP